MDDGATPASEPRVAQIGPYAAELEAGKEYYWCQCGRSKSQPFCDGSHASTNFEPKMFTVTEAKTYFLCGCKTTNTKPYCDGSHAALED